MNAEYKAIVMERKNNHISGLSKMGWSKTFAALRTLENRMHNAAEMYCNGDIDESEYEKLEKRIIAALTKGFGGTLPAGFFVNNDPRGYALKIESESEIAITHRDWGGYYILAPENFN